MKKTYTPAEVAELFGVKDQTVWRWLKKGHLAGIKIGKAWYVTVEAVEKLLASSNTVSAA